MSSGNVRAPRVSVVIAALNVALYIEEAVRSILQQTFTDFELIVVDDGSTDGTWEVLQRLAAQDGRIRLARNSENQGIARARNLGTELARGEFIAVMDGDDISTPDRLEKQVAYLDAHPEIGVVGGQILFLEKGVLSEPKRSYPLTPGFGAWLMPFRVPVLHSTVLMRRKLLLDVGGYDPNYVVAEDHDLWERLGRITQFGNVPDVVFHYRRHGRNITEERAVLVQATCSKIALRAIEREIGVRLTPEESVQMRWGYTGETQQVERSVDAIFHLAHHFWRTNRLTVEEWKLVRRDAAQRILRALRAKPGWRTRATVLRYAAQLDPIYTLRWLRSDLTNRARHKLSARLAAR